ncbi:MAG TPA: ABC transporter permease [Terracidiphilus sp.]|jgi:putative ABC transport system permease protein|nr:ABC transporter permease [Terracidiphilus sp.]
MNIPLTYNLRNLVVRKTTTLMTVAGIALTVAVLVSSLALVNGLRATFANTGNPLQILVLRKGGYSELGSSVSRESNELLRTMSGIARDASSEPMASLEMVQVINLPSVDDPKGMNVTLRGLLPVGIAMRKVHLASGRWFQAGHREVVVGKSIAQRYPDAKLGRHLRFGKGDWLIVAIIDGGQSALNSEIWGDLNQVSSDYNREDNLSSILVRASDEAAVPALINAIGADRQLNLTALSEPAYYASQTSSGAPLEFLGILVAIIMAVGSSFAAMNTMYAAVARRGQEIGTLRVLGFSRRSVLASFLIEALFLSLAGGILGCLMTLPLNGVTTGVGNFFTFSEIAFHFRVGLSTMAVGVVFAIIVGAIGGFFPARNAAKKEILGALYEA